MRSRTFAPPSTGTSASTIIEAGGGAFADPELRQAAAALYLEGTGRGLVKEVGEILGSKAIPVMPLKGVLLQQLVYAGPREGSRAISDVDILVPEERFREAHALLYGAGFTEQQWEGGRWQVTLRRPGAPLCIDLHHRLSRTVRGELTAASLFGGASRNTSLFGVEVWVPRPEDLFCHLVLHAALHWLNRGELHHPEDFGAVPRVLVLDPAVVARVLRAHGLVRHARLVLSLLGTRATPFTAALGHALGAGLRDTLSLRLLHALADTAATGSLRRRAAALLLAPSLAKALVSAARDRWRSAD